MPEYPEIVRHVVIHAQQILATVLRVRRLGAVVIPHLSRDIRKREQVQQGYPRSVHATGRNIVARIWRIGNRNFDGDELSAAIQTMRKIALALQRGSNWHLAHR